MGKATFSKRRFFKGMLIGSVLGVSSAISLAPRSGKETRELINEEINEDIDLFIRIKQQINNISTQTATLKNMKENMVPEFTHDIEKSLQRFDFKTKPRVDIIKTQISKIESELKDVKKDINI